MHAARLWLILLSYQPPHAPVQSATPSISNAFVDECNNKDFLSTIQKLVGDKPTKKVPAVSPKIILLFVRIVATAANHFGGEFDRMRPLIEAKSPERVILLFQPSDEIFYPTTGWASRRRRGRAGGAREPAADDDSALGHPALVVHNTGSSSTTDYVVVDRDQPGTGRPVSRERRTPDPEGSDATWKIELKVARETGELVLHTLQRLGPAHDIRLNGLPFHFITDLVQQCENWKQQLSGSRGGTGTQHQRYATEPANASNTALGQSREFREAMKALDDALEYYARLERGSSPIPPSSERHQRTATAPNSSTNARPFANQRVQPTANQQLHVVTESRGQAPAQLFGQRTGPASLDGHDHRQYQRTPSPSGYQPPSPTAASYHGHTSAREGHEYRGYGQQPTIQAPTGSGRPQPATWSKGTFNRR
ncbi:hypothetical protein FS837_011637 [Tulasnella sp. UAMH 9824]|nr:hypothetical protein FS837_011637 [Tulasnella sp. UAMH 9824]